MAAVPPDVLTTDIISFPVISFGSQWGLFLDGAQITTWDAVISFDYKQDWTIATYPIEEGGFVNYDKVSNPFEARFTFAKGGSNADREAFLSAWSLAASSLSLYSISTPDQVYIDVNISHWDYNRTATQGNGLLSIDVWTMEIRESANTTFANTNAPSAAATVNNGNVTGNPTTSEGDPTAGGPVGASAAPGEPPTPTMPIGPPAPSTNAF